MGGKRVTEGHQGWGSQNQGLARDWRSLSLLTDVLPVPLKGLLTHFDYSGPVVRENITSIRTRKWAALFFYSLLRVVAAPFASPRSLSAPWAGLTQSNPLITVSDVSKNGLIHH